MKGKFTHRVLAAAMVLCMVLALLPAGVLATTVTTTPGNTSLEVEYFSSTLYNWDETKANQATQEVDKVDSSTVSYTSTPVSYNWYGNYNTYTGGSYYVLVNGEYYVVTDMSCDWDWLNRTYSWTVTYSGGSATYTTSSITLYQQSASSTSYEGKGFYFTSNDAHGVDSDSIADFSEWITNAGYDQNYMIYSGLASKVLSESSNAPFDNDTVNAANLFATDGSNEGYTDVYTNVQVPFVYDASTGYYTLDSDRYGVYFENGTGVSGATMLIADKPMGYYAYAGSYYYKCGFAPFNTPSSTTGDYETSDGTRVTGYTITGETPNGTTSNMTYGFGMVTSVEFQMTDDGLDANGEDITFTFSGDDDVWVYIDGYLVLDIGGTHDAITGTINFVTGDVTLEAEGYSYIGDKATGTVYDTNTMSQTNLYTVLGTTLTGFAAQGTHTMTIYYMDRGQGRTNCQIRFNLPQKDSVSVTKEIESTYTGTDEEISDTLMATLNNIDFTFTLYNGSSVVANKSYSLYDADGNFVSTGSTDAAGTFTLKNGYTATFHNISLDEQSSYHVVETSPGERWSATWTATSSVSDATISGGSGLTSDTVTVTGSGTTTDTIHFYCTNSYEPSQSDPDIDLNNDTIVLDYGLPVEVDVMVNDLVTVDGEDFKSDESVELTIDGAVDGTYTGTYGTATVEGNKIVYTMTKQLTGIETITYTVSAEHADKPNSATATLTIIPATLMYYEENFGVYPVYDEYGDETGETTTMVKYSDSNVKWTASVTEGVTYGTYQETGFVGTTTDSTYGTDAVYLDGLKDSYGTSMYANVSGSYGASFEYDFTGTGTAILSRISTDSAYICVIITDENNKTVDWQYIDTRVVENVSGQTTLYNIPVYNNDSLDYGTYHVLVRVYKEGTLLSSNPSGGVFYLDGIRIYNPMGTSEEDGAVGYTTAASAYATDGEANVSIINIRAKVVSDNLTSTDFATLTDVDGNIADVDTYSNIGPNEELYLTVGDTVSFQLVNWDSQSYKIYLGIKAPGDAPGTVTIGPATLTINNGTVCYYDISDCVSVQSIDEDENGVADYYIGTVQITGGEGLIALTNLKVTGVDKLSLGGEQDIYEETEDGATSIALTSLDSDTVYLLSSAITLTVEAEEEEPVVFTPSSIRTSCVYSKLLRRATISISTSSDVSYITINGVKVSGYKMMGNLWFSVSYAKVTAGTTYEIVCYDADGNASETYTVTAK